MLFFPNATICVAEETAEKNEEGTKIKKYDFENPLEEFQADVQPNTLTRARFHKEFLLIPVENE